MGFRLGNFEIYETFHYLFYKIIFFWLLRVKIIRNRGLNFLEVLFFVYRAIQGEEKIVSRDESERPERRS